MSMNMQTSTSLAPRPKRRGNVIASDARHSEDQDDVANETSAPSRGQFVTSQPSNWLTVRASKKLMRSDRLLNANNSNRRKWAIS
jgi:hypothetical protein